MKLTNHSPQIESVLRSIQFNAQPGFNPKQQIGQPIFNSLQLFNSTEHTMQLVDNTLVASLITKRLQGAAKRRYGIEVVWSRNA
jgi:hypothetical protein